MLDIWIEALAWFGGLFVLIKFIGHVSKDADDDLNSVARDELSIKLKRRMMWSELWVPNFIRISDNFFGKKYVSWKSFYKSSLVSICAFTVFYILILPDRIPENDAIIFILAVATVLNLFIDYLSLIETRAILLAKLPILIKLVIDFVITILISIAWLTFVVVVGMNRDTYAVPVTFFEQYQEFFLNFMLEFFSIFGYAQAENFLGMKNIIIIVTMTSLTTSVWLWLFGISQLTIKILSGSSVIMSRLNVKEKPLRAIGLISNIYIFAIGTMSFPIYLYVK